MRPVARMLLAFGAAAILTDRLWRAREAYNEAVASGSKPIEGVGTAVAAFVGLNVR